MGTDDDPVHPSRWAYVRAALITVALLVAIFDDIDPDEPATFARIRGRVFDPLHTAVLDPLELRQRWRLFARPHRHPQRLEIAIRRRDRADGADRADRDSRWEVIYRQGDPARTWDEWRLDYRRVRYFLNPGKKGGRDYRNVATWVAARVMRRMPEVEAVRLQQERLTVPAPGRSREPSDYILQETRTRSQMRRLEARWARAAAGPSGTGGGG
jgi:hypothetical protein